MARKKLAQPEIIEIDEDKFNTDAEAARPGMLAERDQQNESILELGAMIGQIQSFDFILNMGNFAIVQIFEKVKKSNAWKNFKSKNNLTYRNLDEFCEERLGKSYKRLQAMSLNMRILGEDIYEQSEKLGLRQVDYNAIKALPAPDQELIRRAIEEAQSKEDVQQALEQLATQYGGERQAMESKLKDAQEDIEAKTELLDKKNKEIDKLEGKLKRIKKMPPDEALEALRSETFEVMGDIARGITLNFRPALRALLDNSEENRPILHGLIAQLQQYLDNIRDEFNIPRTLPEDHNTDWVDDWNSIKAQEQDSSCEE